MAYWNSFCKKKYLRRGIFLRWEDERSTLEKQLKTNRKLGRQIWSGRRWKRIGRLLGCVQKSAPYEDWKSKILIGRRRQQWHCTLAPQVPHSIPTSIRSGSYSCTSVAIMNTKIEHLAHRRVSASVESRFTKEGRALSLSLGGCQSAALTLSCVPPWTFDFHFLFLFRKGRRRRRRQRLCL